MAEILGKDLDNLDISEAARMPYDMTEGKNEPSGPQFITGTDLERSARISQDWKKPVATIAQVTGQGKITGESGYGVVTQVVNSLGNAAFDAIANLPDNTKNILAQVTLQGTSITPELIEKSRQEILHGKMTDFLPKEKAQAREEMVDVLDRRDYPVAKYAQRVIANATENTNNRALVRELYANARGIDLSKWYNEGAQIVGNMVPLMGLGGVAGATGKALGLSRAATTRLATNIMKGATAIQMGGDYAYETAADYLARTGDTNFENFTAKDAKGFSALAYGAIGAEIEFMGGVEPIVAGSLSKVGLKSGLGRAGLKIAAGEASEEFLQGLTEQLTRVMDGSVNKTWGEALKESLQGAAWGAFIGGTIGTTAFYTNRANLTKNLRKMFPQMKEKEATKLAEKMIETTADVSSQDQTLRDSLRKKVEFMYDGVDIENRENTIDAITDLEYAIINMDSAERGIELADNPIFKGEVNELGWFRDGIPENRRAEIQGYVNEIRDLKAQLKELNSAETKDFVKIDTVEEKLRLAQETALDKVSDLVRKDKDEIRQMLAEQKNNFALRRAIQNIQERARRAMSAKEKSEKATQESAQKAQLKAKTRQEQEVRGAIRGLRNKIDGTSSSQETPETAIAQDMGYQLLKDNGYSNAQIAKMKPRELIQVVQTLARRQLGAEIMFQEQLDLADENARLDDIYPEYKGETINIDGKERTVYNSNGDRIAKSEPALRNFYKWFDDSKVVDEQGRPLVVYHNTYADFDTFTPSQTGTWGPGIYMTPSKRDFYVDGMKKMALYAKIENPFYSNFAQKSSLDWGQIRKDGHDGIIDATKYQNRTGAINEIVAFEPNQIKSVNNRGTFSEDTGNIYFQSIINLPESVSAPTKPENPLPTVRFRDIVAKAKENPDRKVDVFYINQDGEVRKYGSYKLNESGKLVNSDGTRVQFSATEASFFSKDEAEKSIDTYKEYKERLKKYYKEADAYEDRLFAEKKERYIKRFNQIKDNYLAKAVMPFPDSVIRYANYTDDYLGIIDAEAIRKTIYNELKKDGWTPYHSSGKRVASSSFYMRNKNGETIRVSDHELPMTEDRWNKSVDGDRFGWTYEFVITDKEINNMLKLKTRDGVMKYVYDTVGADEYSNKIKTTDSIDAVSDTSGNIYYQSAYAGSRVDYDRPSLEAIGSGEGNQAHGYGLYYALNKDVAEEYRQVFTRGNYDIFVGNKPLPNTIERNVSGGIMYDAYHTGNIEKLKENIKEVIEYLQTPNKWASDIITVGNELISVIDKNPKMSISALTKYIIETHPDEAYRWKNVIKAAVPTGSRTNIQDVKGAIKNHVYPFEQQEKEREKSVKEALQYIGDDFSNISVKESVGQVHEVDIPEMDVLLDEQEMLIDQPQYVQDIIYKINDEIGLNIKDSGIRGGEIYQRLENKLGSDKEASEFLDKYGIKGITYDGRRDGRCFVIFNPKDVKVLRKKFDELGNILFQGRATGTGDKKRGAYVPEYRFVYKANSMDESTLSHELAHDWFEVFYERYRSGAASKEFMTSWGALEKALGITDESTKAERAKASENFARAYEGWILNKKDWEKNLNVDDANRDKIIKEFEKYQGNLRDVYESVMNPYFKNTWGNVGELKPELVNWFERMTNITSLDTLVKRGEMTETEARGEVFNRALDKAIEDSNDPETKRVYENVKTLNDTSRYEVEGGNKNAIQARLSELARAIDENNMAVKKDYNTHRDMMKVAQDADTFVKTRTDEALKIINAEIPEVEGLFKEDLYTALERLAIEESNLDLLDELRSSAVANGLAKEMGQRVAGFRNFMSDGQFDVMSPLKSLDRRFEKATENRKAKKSIEQAADLYAESVREQDATASKNLESFLNELECK